MATAAEYSSSSRGSMSPTDAARHCRLVEIFGKLSVSGLGPNGSAMPRACRIRTNTRNARVSWRHLQSRCRRAAICRAKRYRPTVSAPAPLRATSLRRSARQEPLLRARGFSFQYSVHVERKFEPSDSAAMIQRTAASPFDGGREIYRCNAIHKFKDATLDDKT